jgi:hypothetical protein
MNGAFLKLKHNKFMKTRAERKTHSVGLDHRVRVKHVSPQEDHTSCETPLRCQTDHSEMARWLARPAAPLGPLVQSRWPKPNRDSH